MAKKLICPICEKNCLPFDTECDKTITFTSFNCEHFGRLVWIDQKLLKLDDPVAQLYYTIIIDDMLSRKYSDARYLHYSLSLADSKESASEVFINPATLPAWSNDHLEKMDRALMNLYRMFGENRFRLDSKIGMRTILCYNEESRISMENSLINFGYIAPAESPGEPGDYIISREGWHKIKELRKKETDRTCFIAISFDEITSEIRETLGDAIRETGFEPILINEVEHNNQIVPEIRKYIETSRFLVMDCTYPNNGAYYEAGMAIGMKKEVIMCCRDTEFRNADQRPHFDVVQRSMVIWKDYEDLRKKLTRRILCTVDGARESSSSLIPVNNNSHT